MRAREFRFEVCRCEKTRAEYQKLTLARLGIEYPREYIDRARLLILKNREGHIHGGYLLAMNGPFRVLESIPDEARDESLQRFRSDNTMELTGLWLSAEAQRSGISTWLWLQICKDALTIRRPNYVFAYDIGKAGLGRTYAVFGAQPLFRGLTKIQVGMQEPCEESVEYTTRWRILASLAKSPAFFLKRARGRHTKRAIVAPKLIEDGTT